MQARIGTPAPTGLPVLLVREFRPMIRQVRAALPKIRTVGDVRALGAALRRTWPDARVFRLVRPFGERGEAQASKAWSKVDRALARERGDSAERFDARKYDGQKLVDRWTKDAAGRISSVRDEVAEALRKDVVAALEDGTDPSDLAAQWISEGVPVKFGTLEGRMKVIAHHQLSTLHAQVQSERARAVGVTDFVWRTQGDDRVRDAHVALDGTRHRYDDPPDEGLPGTPVNCRCWAESVIPDELAAALGFVIEG